jgi:heptaprenyl diphosphate synthase
MKTRKITLLGILTALSAIMFMVESLFPPLFVPGAKLGLGNIFVMLALIYLGFGEAVIMVVAKCLIAAIFGGFSALLYSLPSGLVAVGVSQIFLQFSKRLSIVSISAVAATIHNLVQNVVFAFVTKSTAVLSYAPYLALLGVICGVLTGICVFLILRTLTPFVIKKFKLEQI